MLTLQPKQKKPRDFKVMLKLAFTHYLYIQLNILNCITQFLSIHFSFYNQLVIVSCHDLHHAITQGELIKDLRFSIHY